MQRGSARLEVAFDFPAESANHGFFSAFDLGAIDIPLSNVQLGQNIHWEIVGDSTTTVFDGLDSGQRISGRFVEGRHQGTFLLRRVAATTEKPYRQRDVTFWNKDVRLSGTLYLPRDSSAHPAVLLVQGSGAEGRWASAYLADYMARHGIAALAYDKRGVGGSSGDWRTSTPPDLVTDARAGIDLLAMTPQVDPRRIGVFGHSQGGQLAPAIAEGNPRVSWIIDADGPVGPQYQQDIFRVDTILAQNYSGRELADAERLYAEFVNVARGGLPHTRLRADIQAAGTARWLDNLAIPEDNSWIWAWYANYGNYDNSSAWATISVPVLILFGGQDELVPSRQTVDQTVEILKSHGNAKVTARIFADADHTVHVPPRSADGWPTLPHGYPDIIIQFVLHASSQ